MPEPYLKYSADQMKFNGYATRYLSPRETGSWRVSEAFKTGHLGTGLFWGGVEGSVRHCFFLGGLRMGKENMFLSNVGVIWETLTNIIFSDDFLFFIYSFSLQFSLFSFLFSLFS